MAQISQAVGRLVALAALAALSGSLAVGSTLRLACGLAAAQAIVDILWALTTLL